MAGLDALARRSVAASLLAVACASAPLAQTKPGFSGTWIEQTPNVVAAEKALERTQVLFERGLLRLADLESAQVRAKYLREAATMVVVQTDTTITARHGGAENSPVTTYNLNGAESRNVVRATGAVTVAKAAWEGSRLVIAETTTFPDGRTTQSKRVWWLDNVGQLVVETGDATNTHVSVYRKQPPVGALPALKCCS